MPQLFYIVSMGMDENTFWEFSASELRAKVFSLEETEFLKRKTVAPLNANEQDKSPFRHHYKMLGKYAKPTDFNHFNIL